MRGRMRRTLMVLVTAAGGRLRSTASRPSGVGEVLAVRHTRRASGPARPRAAVVGLSMIAVGVFAFTGGGGVADAAPITGGDITAVCTGTTSGTTFTLTADCGEVTTSLTVPPTITTVDGGGHILSATDIGGAQFNGAVLTNATAGQTMNLQNLTVSGPATGFQLCTNAGNVLY